IGMDEAGLGPNLGPFVVAASVWEVPSSPGGFDFWTAFDTVLTNAPRANEGRLHVADSKRVFQPGNGIGALERGVLTALRLCGVEASTLRDLSETLCGSVAGNSNPGTESQKRPAPERKEEQSGVRSTSSAALSLFDDAELLAARSPVEAVRDGETPLPWYDGDDVTLPVKSGDLSLAAPWQALCERLGVRLVSICADVVEPERFNRLVRWHDNKAAATSRIAMQVLRRAWPLDRGDEVLVVADKHGGRNRYEPLLTEAFPERTVVCLEEGADRSVYRMGNCEIRFQPRAEEHGPVALASMTAKYLRELAMHQFNRFWRERIPGLKPTQGYPLDAKRFRVEIADLQRSLGIADDVLWRER
ncbi:MAG: hypothetical protein H7062_21025, partial [Candidatus Saccharimonas sp.]|nr:hypothetical protein [Planctomycetaceae bacterium]